MILSQLWADENAFLFGCSAFARSAKVVLGLCRGCAGGAVPGLCRAEAFYEIPA